MARSLRLEELFEGRHFDREIIVLCVRWYLRFKLSFWDLVENDGRTWPVDAPHRHYAPEFEHRWNRLAQPSGASWRMDETSGSPDDLFKTDGVDGARSRHRDVPQWSP